MDETARQAMATSTAPGLAVALVHHGRVRLSTKLVMTQVRPASNGLTDDLRR